MVTTCRLLFTCFTPTTCLAIFSAVFRSASLVTLPESETIPPSHCTAICFGASVLSAFSIAWTSVVIWASDRAREHATDPNARRRTQTEKKTIYFLRIRDSNRDGRCGRPSHIKSVLARRWSHELVLHKVQCLVHQAPLRDLAVGRELVDNAGKQFGELRACNIGVDSRFGS